MMTLLLVISVLGGLVVIDLGVNFLVRKQLGRRLLKLESLLFFGLIGASVSFLFFSSVPFVPAVSLFIAGLLVYMQCKSIFSRGYSIRILLDLYSLGKPSSMEKLKNNYGQGQGVKGLLLKRFQSMASIGLLKIEGESLGPLSTLGRFCGMAGLMSRKLLGLENVG